MIHSIAVVCTECGYRCEQSECINGPDEKPQPGNMAMCLNCGALYEITQEGWKTLELESLKPEERAMVTEARNLRKKMITQDLSFNQQMRDRESSRKDH